MTLGYPVAGHQNKTDGSHAQHDMPVLTGSYPPKLLRLVCQYGRQTCPASCLSHPAFFRPRCCCFRRGRRLRVDRQSHRDSPRADPKGITRTPATCRMADSQREVNGFRPCGVLAALVGESNGSHMTVQLPVKMLRPLQE